MTRTPIASAAHRWTAALVLSGAVFLVVFDSLSVATALPSIGSQLRMSPVQLSWVVNLTSLIIGGLLLLGGRVADLWGRRRILVASLALLTAGSLVAGTATSMPMLLTGRALQGLASAFALPTALALTGALFPEQPWRNRAFTVAAVFGGTAGLAGAICGGMLTSTLGWRSIFLVTLPVNLTVMVAAIRVLPLDPARTDRPRRLDLVGAVLVTAGLVVVIFGLGRIGESGPWRVDALGAVAAGAALLACFAAVERRTANPLMRLNLLRSRRLTGGSLGIAAHSAVHSVIVVVGSLHLQDTHRLSPAAAGLALTPALIAATASGPLGARLVAWTGARPVAAAGLALDAVALTLLAVNAGNPSYTTAVLPWLILQGIGGGWIYLALTQATIGGVGDTDRGTRAGIFEAATHIGGATAVATYLALIASSLGYRGAYLAGAILAVAGALAVSLVMPRTLDLRSIRPPRPAAQHAPSHPEPTTPPVDAP